MSNVLGSSLTDYERYRSYLFMSKREQFLLKVQRGEYNLEHVGCFCGADADLELSTIDRYEIPHRMVICQECALIRANPRMNGPSTWKFYDNEYRHIVPIMSSKFFPLNNDTDRLALYRSIERTKGIEHIRKWVDAGRPLPRMIADFGCRYGGQLSIWKDAGCIVYGIESSAHARRVGEKDGIKMYATLDKIIEDGIKVNLIVMQDVIEHLLGFDLLDKIAELLVEGGILYVFTPGMLGSTPKSGNMFHIAHTYQFSAGSLKYIMQRKGWFPLEIDEDIYSLWKWVGISEDNPPKPKEYVKFTLDNLEAHNRKVKEKLDGNNHS